MIIGVTGNIGAGKSTVARILKERLSAVLVDADALGNHVRETNSDIQRQIIVAFGSDVTDEERRLDRKKLAKFVFKDPARLTILNKIFFPVLTYEVRMEVMRAGRMFNYVILDAALIVEWNMQSQVDHLVVVSAKKQVRINRLTEYRRMLEDDAEERVAAQGDDEFKKQFANTVIDNNGTLNELEIEVDKFIESITK
ncbi:MAG: dephospho-CoA kinase [Fibrobacteres bacterium]|nr:dephospho-CoA kinase [Fibrobacterota bacterium]